MCIYALVPTLNAYIESKRFLSNQSLFSLSTFPNGKGNFGINSKKRRTSGYRFRSKNKTFIAQHCRLLLTDIATHAKRRRNSEKQSSHKFVHPVFHPYLNSSVHFAQFSANPNNIPNMTRSWINSSPRYVAERKRQLPDGFFLYIWEVKSPLWEGSYVCHCKPCLHCSSKKQDTCPKEISRENNCVFPPLLMFLLWNIYRMVASVVHMLL